MFDHGIKTKRETMVVVVVVMVVVVVVMVVVVWRWWWWSVVARNGEDQDESLENGRLAFRQRMGRLEGEGRDSVPNTIVLVNGVHYK